jgi:hypothetical protein
MARHSAVAPPAARYARRVTEDDPKTPTPIPATDAPQPPARRRPLIERLGLAVIAVVFGALFAFVGVAAFLGGQPFLGVMGLIGCLMVIWVGGITLFRG